MELSNEMTKYGGRQAVNKSFDTLRKIREIEAKEQIHIAGAEH